MFRLIIGNNHDEAVGTRCHGSWLSSYSLVELFRKSYNLHSINREVIMAQAYGYSPGRDGRSDEQKEIDRAASEAEHKRCRCSKCDAEYEKERNDAINDYWNGR